MSSCESRHHSPVASYLHHTRNFASTRPVLATLLLSTLLVSLGGLGAAIFNTAYDTSIYSSAPPHQQSNNYFANKSNIFNQGFVKILWVWIILFQILQPLNWIDPAPGFSRIQRPYLVRLLAAFSFYFVFTGSRLYRGLNHHIRHATGGTCAVQLPTEWAKSEAFSASEIEPKLLVRHGGAGPDDSTYWLPVEPSYCEQATSLSPESHPNIFDWLKTSFSTLETEPSLTNIDVKARLTHGHDVSGHVFLLTMGTALVVWELSSARSYVKKYGYGRWKGLVLFGFLCGCAFVGVSTWMLFMTSIFFHTASEKLTGLLFGIAGTAFLGLCDTALNFALHGKDKKKGLTPNTGADLQATKGPSNRKAIELNEVNAQTEPNQLNQLKYRKS